MANKTEGVGVPDILVMQEASSLRWDPNDLNDAENNVRHMEEIVEEHLITTKHELAELHSDQPISDAQLKELYGLPDEDSTRPFAQDRKSSTSKPPRLLLPVDNPLEQATLDRPAATRPKKIPFTVSKRKAERGREQKIKETFLMISRRLRWYQHEIVKTIEVTNEDEHLATLLELNDRVSTVLSKADMITNEGYAPNEMLADKFAFLDRDVSSVGAQYDSDSAMGSTGASTAGDINAGEGFSPSVQPSSDSPFGQGASTKTATKFGMHPPPLHHLHSLQHQQPNERGTDKGKDTVDFPTIVSIVYVLRRGGDRAATLMSVEQLITLCNFGGEVNLAAVKEMMRAGALQSLLSTLSRAGDWPEVELQISKLISVLVTYEDDWALLQRSAYVILSSLYTLQLKTRIRSGDGNRSAAGGTYPHGMPSPPKTTPARLAESIDRRMVNRLYNGTVRGVRRHSTPNGESPSTNAPPAPVPALPHVTSRYTSSVPPMLHAGLRQGSKDLSIAVEDSSCSKETESASTVNTGSFEERKDVRSLVAAAIAKLSLVLSAEWSGSTKQEGNGGGTHGGGGSTSAGPGGGLAQLSSISERGSGKFNVDSVTGQYTQIGMGSGSLSVIGAPGNRGAGVGIAVGADKKGPAGSASSDPGKILRIMINLILTVCDNTDSSSGTDAHAGSSSRRGSLGGLGAQQGLGAAAAAVTASAAAQIMAVKSSSAGAGISTVGGSEGQQSTSAYARAKRYFFPDDGGSVSGTDETAEAAGGGESTCSADSVAGSVSGTAPINADAVGAPEASASDPFHAAFEALNEMLKPPWCSLVDPAAVLCSAALSNLAELPQCRQSLVSEGALKIIKVWLETAVNVVKQARRLCFTHFLYVDSGNDSNEEDEVALEDGFLDGLFQREQADPRRGGTGGAGGFARAANTGGAYLSPGDPMRSHASMNTLSSASSLTRTQPHTSTPGRYDSACASTVWSSAPSSTKVYSALHTPVGAISATVAAAAAAAAESQRIRRLRAHSAKAFRLAFMKAFGPAYEMLSNAAAALMYISGGVDCRYCEGSLFVSSDNAVSGASGDYMVGFIDAQILAEGLPETVVKAILCSVEDFNSVSSTSRMTRSVLPAAIGMHFSQILYQISNRMQNRQPLQILKIPAALCILFENVVNQVQDYRYSHKADRSTKSDSLSLYSQIFGFGGIYSQGTHTGFLPVNDIAWESTNDLMSLYSTTIDEKNRHRLSVHPSSGKANKSPVVAYTPQHFSHTHLPQFRQQQQQQQQQHHSSEQQYAGNSGANNRAVEGYSRWEASFMNSASFPYSVGYESDDNKDGEVLIGKGFSRLGGSSSSSSSSSSNRQPHGDGKGPQDHRDRSGEKSLRGVEEEGEEDAEEQFFATMTTIMDSITSSCLYSLINFVRDEVMLLSEGGAESVAQAGATSAAIAYFVSTCMSPIDIDAASSSSEDDLWLMQLQQAAAVSTSSASSSASGSILIDLPPQVLAQFQSLSLPMMDLLASQKIVDSILKAASTLPRGNGRLAAIRFVSSLTAWPTPLLSLQEGTVIEVLVAISSEADELHMPENLITQNGQGGVETGAGTGTGTGGSSKSALSHDRDDYSNGYVGGGATGRSASFNSGGGGVPMLSIPKPHAVERNLSGGSTISGSSTGWRSHRSSHLSWMGERPSARSRTDASGHYSNGIENDPDQSNVTPTMSRDENEFEIAQEETLYACNALANLGNTNQGYAKRMFAAGLFSIMSKLAKSDNVDISWEALRCLSAMCPVISNEAMEKAVFMKGGPEKNSLFLEALDSISFALRSSDVYVQREAVHTTSQLALINEQVRDHIVETVLRPIISLLIDPKNNRDLRAAAEEVLKNVGFPGGVKDFECCGFDFEILRDWYAMERALKPQDLAHDLVEQWMNRLFDDINLHHHSMETFNLRHTYSAGAFTGGDARFGGSGGLDFATKTMNIFHSLHYNFLGEGGGESSWSGVESYYGYGNGGGGLGIGGGGAGSGFSHGGTHSSKSHFGGTASSAMSIPLLQRHFTDSLLKLLPVCLKPPSFFSSSDHGNGSNSGSGSGGSDGHGSTIGHRHSSGPFMTPSLMSSTPMRASLAGPETVASYLSPTGSGTAGWGGAAWYGEDGFYDWIDVPPLPVVHLLDIFCTSRLHQMLLLDLTSLGTMVTSAPASATASTAAATSLLPYSSNGSSNSSNGEHSDLSAAAVHIQEWEIEDAESAPRESLDSFYLLPHPHPISAIVLPSRTYQSFARVGRVLERMFEYTDGARKLWSLTFRDSEYEGEFHTSFISALRRCPQICSVSFASGSRVEEDAFMGHLVGHVPSSVRFLSFKSTLSKESIQALCILLKKQNAAFVRPTFDTDVFTGGMIHRASQLPYAPYTPYTRPRMYNNGANSNVTARSKSIAASASASTSPSVLNGSGGTGAGSVRTRKRVDMGSKGLLGLALTHFSFEASEINHIIELLHMLPPEDVSTVGGGGGGGKDRDSSSSAKSPLSTPSTPTSLLGGPMRGSSWREGVREPMFGSGGKSFSGNNIGTSAAAVSLLMEQEQAHALAREEIANLRGLRYMDLSYNNLTDSQCANILNAALHGPLEGLELAGNFIHRGNKFLDVLEALSPAKSSRPQYLHHLGLSDNGFGAKFVAVLLRKLSSNRSLTSLDISRNDLDHTASTNEVLREFLRKNNYLRRLDLSFTRLNKDSFRMIQLGMLENNTMLMLPLLGNYDLKHTQTIDLIQMKLRDNRMLYRYKARVDNGYSGGMDGARDKQSTDMGLGAEAGAGADCEAAIATVVSSTTAAATATATVSAVEILEKEQEVMSTASDAGSLDGAVQAEASVVPFSGSLLSADTSGDARGGGERRNGDRDGDLASVAINGEASLAALDDSSNRHSAAEDKHAARLSPFFSASTSSATAGGASSGREQGKAGASAAGPKLREYAEEMAESISELDAYDCYRNSQGIVPAAVGALARPHPGSVRPFPIPSHSIPSASASASSVSAIDGTWTDAAVALPVPVSPPLTHVANVSQPTSAGGACIDAAANAAAPLNSRDISAVPGAVACGAVAQQPEIRCEPVVFTSSFSPANPASCSASAAADEKPRVAARPDLEFKPDRTDIPVELLGYSPASNRVGSSSEEGSVLASMVSNTNASAARQVSTSTGGEVATLSTLSDSAVTPYTPYTPHTPQIVVDGCSGKSNLSHEGDSGRDAYNSSYGAKANNGCVHGGGGVGGSGDTSVAGLVGGVAASGGAIDGSDAADSSGSTGSSLPLSEINVKLHTELFEASSSLNAAPASASAMLINSNNNKNNNSSSSNNNNKVSMKLKRNTSGSDDPDAVIGVNTSVNSSGNARNTLNVLFSAPLAGFDRSAKIHPLEVLDHAAERDILIQVFKEVHRDIDLHFDYATTDTLRTALSFGCKALHFSGHGIQNGLCFEDGRSGLQVVNTTRLRDLLGAGGLSLQFVFVSACYSKEIGEAFVRAGVPHVVCVKIDSKIQDAAAISFTRAFYVALLSSRTVKDSFDIAKEALKSSPYVPDSILEGEKFILLPETGAEGVHGSHTDLQAQQQRLHSKVIFRNRPFSEWPTISRSHNHCTIGANRTEMQTFLARNRLPSPPADFVGREVIMHNTIRRILDRRLVSLVGEDGVGKSAVAAAVCKYIGDRELFHDSVVFLRAKGIKDYHSFLAELQRTLLVSGSNAVSQRISGILSKEKSASADNLVYPEEEHIFSCLEPMKLLLVIDSLDDLLADYGDTTTDFRLFLGRLFEQCPGVKLLVVSTNTLSMQNISVGLGILEYSVAVGPLTLHSSLRLFARLAPTLLTAKAKAEFIGAMQPSGTTSHVTVHCREASDVVRKILFLFGDGHPAKIVHMASESTAESVEHLKRIGTHIIRSSLLETYPGSGNGYFSHSLHMYPPGSGPTAHGSDKSGSGRYGGAVSPTNSVTSFYSSSMAGAGGGGGSVGGGSVGYGSHGGYAGGGYGGTEGGDDLRHTHSPSSGGGGNVYASSYSSLLDVADAVAATAPAASKLLSPTAALSASSASAEDPADRCTRKSERDVSDTNTEVGAKAYIGVESVHDSTARIGREGPEVNGVVPVIIPRKH